MAITRASTAADGTQGNNASGGPSLSGDGTLVAFSTAATNLGVPDPSAAVLSEIFVKNLATGEIVRASSNTFGSPLSGTAFAPSLATDGSAVAFSTRGSELLADPNLTQIAVTNLSNGDISVVSAAADGTQGNDDSAANPSISGDGRLVAFTSRATNLVASDTNATLDIFVKNVATGAITRASTAADGTQGNGESNVASMAGDGSRVAFQSDATNLVAGDTNGTMDIFVKNLATGAITNASTAADGTGGNGGSFNPSVSRDGNLVAFSSSADNLVAGDTNGRADVFVKNLATGAITRVSTGTDGTQGNAESGSARISADGTTVTFTSRAGNLVPGDTNIVSDVFVKDLTTGALTRVSGNASGVQGNGASNGGSLSADGSRVAFQSNATNLVPGDTNNVSDVFVADVICFATGTRLRTARGEVAVEELRVGDQAVTVGGATRPVRWIGSRSLDGRGTALPFAQQPVRIRAGAFGDGLPVRDLFLSPGHPVLVGAHLVPVMCLVNGTSVARMPAEAVTYWHVELDAHDILLAEGLPAESYLDLGSRPWFAGSDAPLHDPEFAATDAPGRCRPVVVEGPVVEAERRRLDALFAASLADACAWDGSGDLPWLTA
ncbi:Hint domain-containing protein [uncultured Methylobacterium sp.]|jgi:dipeptidyl aminopeptidase/acylaminoacyl peptidase|uniref:Hint domain-containing protein n=1 Tax=uncultured Methylobacterium sp. TaxID=157278 RepID=UPI002636EF91|nr:Hint domain-containing protein [uncultured Methylobacterium sp.]